MAKNLPCAGCGEMMWRSRTSAPEGIARCLPCRRGSREVFTAPNGTRTTHGTSGYHHGCRCATCKTATSERAKKWNAAYTKKHGHHYSSGWRRRFKEEHGFWPQGSGTEFVDAPTRRAIYERDGWTCQLCASPIDPAATEHADRASLDHIVPQSRGGTHEPSNLRMSHVGCNASRRDRMDEADEQIKAGAATNAPRE